MAQGPLPAPEGGSGPWLKLEDVYRGRCGLRADPQRARSRQFASHTAGTSGSAARRRTADPTWLAARTGSVTHSRAVVALRGVSPAGAGAAAPDHPASNWRELYRRERPGTKQLMTSDPTLDKLLISGTSDCGR